MFSSIVMDVAIGLMFVYIFLSVVCSMITEWLASWRKWRPQMLFTSIQGLIGDEQILHRFFRDPLFLGGDEKTGKPTEAYHPSYISSRGFALALVSSLQTAEPGKPAPPPP